MLLHFHVISFSTLFPSRILTSMRIYTHHPTFLFLLLSFPFFCPSAIYEEPPTILNLILWAAIYSLVYTHTLQLLDIHYHRILSYYVLQLLSKLKYFFHLLALLFCTKIRIYKCYISRFHHHSYGFSHCHISLSFTQL